LAESKESPEEDDTKEPEPPAATPAAGGPRFRPPIRREAAEGPPARGLKSVEASRAERNKIKRPPMRVIAWFLIVTVVALALYFRHSAGQLDRDRQRLLADQRAVESELGKIWFPLRDRVEGWTVDLAKEDISTSDATSDKVDREALASFPFQELSGLYLRLRADQAATPEAVRQAAQTSLRDGFTACLMRTPSGDPMAGKECNNSTECEPGQLCNEFYHCAPPGQPYNLRLAYKTLFVLTPEWITDVQQVDNDLRLRALRGTFDQANRIEFPVAVTLLTGAKCFLVVVDEKPAPPAPSSGSGADAGVAHEDEETLSGKLHPLRVGLWRLSDGKQLLRMRRNADPKLREPAGSIAVDPAARAATLRQAQSCELAQEVRCAIGDPGASCGKP
jgi:hypothetical protein